MSDMKINSHYGLLKDYLRQKEFRPTPTGQPLDLNGLKNLKSSLDRVHQAAQSTEQQLKIAQITKEIATETYHLDMEHLIEQIVAEELLGEVS